ncbi:hypothetical protein N9137_00865 [Pseudomonadales bacterium]|nr:hypothetical protein [Pseudomonadales bacterium]
MISKYPMPQTEQLLNEQLEKIEERYPELAKSLTGNYEQDLFILDCITIDFDMHNLIVSLCLDLRIGKDINVVTNRSDLEALVIDEMLEGVDTTKSTIDALDCLFAFRRMSGEYSRDALKGPYGFNVKYLGLDNYELHYRRVRIMTISGEDRTVTYVNPTALYLFRLESNLWGY